jgi:hypothetical protein
MPTGVSKRTSSIEDATYSNRSPRNSQNMHLYIVALLNTLIGKTLGTRNQAHHEDHCHQNLPNTLPRPYKELMEELPNSAPIPSWIATLTGRIGALSHT